MNMPEYNEATLTTEQKTPAPDRTMFEMTIDKKIDMSFENSRRMVSQEITTKQMPGPGQYKLKSPFEKKV